MIAAAKGIKIIWFDYHSLSLFRYDIAEQRHALSVVEFNYMLWNLYLQMCLHFKC